jgi:transcription elongation GreA/GreB family factor
LDGITREIIREIIMDKVFLLENLIGILRNELDSLTAQYESAKLNSIDAPHRMESRYDTSGIEAAWLSDGLANRIQEKKKLIAQTSSFALDNIKVTDKVVPGCIVELTEKSSGVKNNYFLLPFNSGGYVLNYGGREIIIVGIGSPIGKKMLLKKINDVITVGEDNTEFGITNFF